MANAEAALAAAGPRYAPDDPTLPKPWKGLIDGSTGLTYYWNPETNITQYEKPAGEVRPLLSAVPPVNTVSQSAAQHGQPGEVSQYPSQYMNQLSQQQGQFHSSVTGQVPHQQPSQILASGVPSVDTVSQSTAQHGQPGEVSMYSSQYTNQTSQQGQFHSSVTGQAPHQQPSQIPPTGQLGSYSMQHHANFGQGIHERGPQGGQMPRQYGSHMGQQTDQHIMPQQGSHVAQQPGQRLPELGQQTGQHIMPQQGSHVTQQPGQILSELGQQASQLHSPPVGQSQGHQFTLQQTHYASYHQSMLPHGQPNAQPHSQHMPQGPRFPHQQDGRNTGFEGNQQVRGGQGFHFNANNEAPAIAAQHPNLAAIPIARNQQDMRMGSFTHHNTPGPDNSFNAGAGHGMHSMFNHANVDPPIPNQALMRPTPLMSGSTDAMNMPSAEAYRLQHEVTATGENVPAPYMTFEAAGFSPEILRELQSAGFASPTPIQAQTWPIARQHRDIVAIAKTGSGKTLGYLMPAFMHLKERRNNPRYGPTVLILAPTRELATQIQAEAIKFGRSSRLICVCLYGGAQKGPQLEELRRGADIVVATPGRLNDVLETKHIDLGQVSLLVLDEADRMLDMGFEPQIRKVVNEIPPRRQTLMYTATWPKEVRKIASDLLHDPVQVNIGSVDELAANKSITQYVEVVPYLEKQRRLEQILRAQERGSKVIIFCSTKRMCDELARNIRRNFPTAVIHGDKNQGERDYVLNQFRSGESPILIATDVAARGLDVKDIRVVINYDFPTGVEDYVHRIGRTGRAGNTGVAYTFFSDQDWKHAADLVKVLEGAEQPVPPEVRDMALRGGPPFNKDRSGMNNRFEPGPALGGGRWDSGGRGGGTRDGGFNGGRDGMRDGGFGGRGGMRDSGFGFRGGPRDGGFGGRGMRDGGAMNNRGGRNDFGGRGNRGRGFGPPGGGYGGRSRDDYGSNDRMNNRDGFGRGRGRGRFDNNRDGPRRSRGRSYSSSPEKVSTWDHSRSRSRSRSRSWSRSRSPRRSYSRSRSPRRSYSRSPRRSYDRNRGRSRSRSYDRPERPARRASGFDKLPESGTLEQKDITTPIVDTPFVQQVTTLGSDVNNNPIPGKEIPDDREKPIVSGGVDDQFGQFAAEV